MDVPVIYAIVPGNLCPAFPRSQFAALHPLKRRGPVGEACVRS